MNRHKSNWSAMGLNERKDQSQISKDYIKLRKDLEFMINYYGIDEVLREIRKINIVNG